MMRSSIAVFLFFASGVSQAVALRALGARQPLTQTNGTVVPTAEAVMAERSSIARYAAGLNTLLTAKAGALGGSRVVPTLRLFVQKLNSVLDEVKDIKDPVLAMAKLKAAKAGVSTLVGDLTAQQESLMAENSAQQESLLLGVLMTRQHATMEQQLEVLKSSDFASLPVAKALLTRHNATVPLFTQAAEYLDKHHGKAGQATATQVIGSGAMNKEVEVRSHMFDLAGKFEKRVEALQRELDARSKQHDAKMRELNSLISKGTKRAQHEVQVLRFSKKREERNYKKWAATRKHDLLSMKAAVDAMRKGDVAALEHVRKAMTESLKALKSRGQGFLVLIQQGHQFLARECPYCAAQCLDVCHEKGESYSQCLTECADASKETS